MDTVHEQLPYALETLEPEKLQFILEHFAPVFPFPLLVVTLEGVVLASSAPTLYHSSSPAYRIEQARHRISESGASQEPRGREVLGAPILVHHDLIGYVVGDHESDDASEALYATNLQLLATFIGDKSYTEYELRNLTEELLEKYSEITLIYDI